MPTIMAVCESSHPCCDAAHGESVRVYSVNPDLDEIYQELGSLPYVRRDENGDLYMSAMPQNMYADGECPLVAVYICYTAIWALSIEHWLDGMPVFSSEAFIDSEQPPENAEQRGSD